MSALAVRDLQVTFPGASQPALDIDRLDLESGAQVAVTGPSGSGKTTLAYALTGIQPAERGTVRWAGTDLAGLTESRRDRWRRRHVGMVFQDFHLVPGLSVLQNVLAPIYFARLAPAAAELSQARALLERFGIPPERKDVATLSRGEQQRVAIARALLRDPPILVADEPTASLDPASAHTVIELLVGEALRRKATLVVVSHDPAMIAAAGRILRMENGRLA